MSTPINSTAKPSGDSFLPDFCHGPAIFSLLLTSQMVAIVFVLGSTGDDLLPATRLVVVSLFLHWISLPSAAALCWLRRRLHHQPVAIVAACAMTIMLGITVLVSEAGFQIGRLLQWEQFAGMQAHQHFLVRNLLLAAIVAILLLRFFFLKDARTKDAAATAEARFAALQARIRPHFFFNSLNSVAALISIRPQEAEKLLEDLSDLFRAILKNKAPLNSLDEEIELAQTYLRIEQLRLGDRLRVHWELPEDRDGFELPLLSLQPLLENAIYHGIEKLPEGGDIRVRMRQEEDHLCIRVDNPMNPQQPSSPGSRIAQDNIRQRLRLLYDGQAKLKTSSHEGEYRAELCIPL